MFHVAIVTYLYIVYITYVDTINWSS